MFPPNRPTSAINSSNAPTALHQQVADALSVVPTTPEQAMKQQMLANLLGVGLQNQNVLYRQLLQSFDPRYISQINNLANKLASALNGNIPLQVGVMVSHTGAITRPESGDPPSRTLNYYFPQFFYAISVTATVRSARFNANEGPDTLFQGQNNPLDYVSVRIRREQNQRITYESAGTQTSLVEPTNDFVPLSHVSGTGSLPYTFDLIQLVNQGGLLTVDVQIAPEIASVADVLLSFHGIQQPIG